MLPNVTGTGLKNPGPARARDSGWGGEIMGGPAQITLSGWARPLNL